MKLKSIIHALGYGRSRKQLVRSEGARSVKQAEKLADNRLREKSLLSPFRYGMGTGQLASHLVQNTVRSGDKIGIQLLEVDFAETERKIASWVSGRQAGKGDSKPTK